jgi:hypothetical protein
VYSVGTESFGSEEHSNGNSSFAKLAGCASSSCSLIHQSHLSLPLLEAIVKLIKKLVLMSQSGHRVKSGSSGPVLTKRNVEVFTRFQDSKV